MKKIIIFLLSIIGAVVILSGCTENNKGPEVVIDNFEPPSYVYGLLEKCSDGTNYCTLKSIEITSSYDFDGDIKDSGSGYYVIIVADTNLSEKDMSNSDNRVVFHISANQQIRLEFLTWDEEKGELIYEIPYIESLDYARLCDLKASNKKPNLNKVERPALFVRIKYYSRTFFWLTLE